MRIAGKRELPCTDCSLTVVKISHMAAQVSDEFSRYLFGSPLLYPMKRGQIRASESRCSCFPPLRSGAICRLVIHSSYLPGLRPNLTLLVLNAWLSEAHPTSAILTVEENIEPGSQKLHWKLFV